MSNTALPPRRPTAQALSLYTITILSCFLSGSLTIHFCWALRETETLFSAIWAIGMGVTWELGKLAFAPMGLRLLASRCKRDVAIGFVLCCLSGILITGSIIASVGYFTRVDDQHTMEAMRASRRYQDLRLQVDSIDDRMRILTKSADADAQAGYRTRAMATLEQTRNLQKDRMHLSQQLDALESSGGNTDANASGIFRTLGVLSSDVATNASRLKLLAHIVIAGVLEMLSIASVWALNRQKSAFATPHDISDSDADAKMQLHFSPPTTKLPDALDASVASNRKKIIRLKMQNMKRIKSDDASVRECKVVANNDVRYQHAKTLVWTGEIAPTYRAIQSALHLGQATVQRYLKAMRDEGLICRDGRRYIMVSANG